MPIQAEGQAKRQRGSNGLEPSWHSHPQLRHEHLNVDNDSGDGCAIQASLACFWDTIHRNKMHTQWLIV